MYFLEQTCGECDHRLGFLSLRDVWRSRIAQFPCIVGQDIRFVKERGKRAIDCAARFAKFFEIVGTPKGGFMPRQKSLEGFFRRLPAEEEGVAEIAGNDQRLGRPRSSEAFRSHSRVSPARAPIGFIEQRAFANNGCRERCFHPGSPLLKICLPPRHNVLGKSGSAHSSAPRAGT